MYFFTQKDLSSFQPSEVPFTTFKGALSDKRLCIDDFVKDIALTISETGEQHRDMTLDEFFMEYTTCCERNHIQAVSRINFTRSNLIKRLYKGRERTPGKRASVYRVPSTHELSQINESQARPLPPFVNPDQGQHENTNSQTPEKSVSFSPTTDTRSLEKTRPGSFF